MNTRASKYCSVCNIKINIIPMGIFMGAQSMHHNSTARDDSMDSQLDSGSPCNGDSKEGLHLRIALVFTCHFYFEGKSTKAYIADNG